MINQEFLSVAPHLPSFFGGGNGGSGFQNYLDQLCDPGQDTRLFILKGGPGTGKSTFMKKLVLDMRERGVTAWLFYCSSDPDSLDGVLFPSIGAAVVDGTAPHVMEPHYPGVREQIVNLMDCLDTDYLAGVSGELLPLYRQNSRLHRQASRFLQAAARLADDSYAIACEASDLDRAEQTAEAFCRERFLPLDRTGRERRFALSGFTPQGPCLLENSLPLLAKEIYAVNDEYGAASSVILSTLRVRALAAGYEVITLPCTLTPGRKIDHLILPELSLAVCSCNTALPITVDNHRRLHARRFRDAEKIGRSKQRLRFNKRATEELLDGACHNLREAHDVHDQIEAFYIRAMDFEREEQMRLSVLRQLEKRI